MQDARFEWDDDKAASNQAKHNLTFRQAVGVFDDPRAIERFDESEDYGEERFIITGSVASSTGDRLVSVVYTERARRKRIISARKATRHEQDAYFQQDR